MAITKALLTGDVANLVGEDFNPKSTKVWVAANVDRIIDTANNVIYLGTAAHQRADQAGTNNYGIEDDGTFVFDLIATGSADTNLDDSDDLQYTVWVDYGRASDRTRRKESFGPYYVTGNADIAELEPAQAVDVGYASAALTEMQEILDAQAEIAGIDDTDSAVAGLANPLVGPLTRAAFDATYDRKTRYDLRDFGTVYFDGTTDNTALIQTAITQLCTTAGGELFFPPGGVIRGHSAALVITDDGSGDAFPLQYPIRLTGAGGDTTCDYQHFDPSSYGGTILDLRWPGTAGSVRWGSTEGKIMGKGSGTVEIDHMTIADLGSSPNPPPFIYGTMPQWAVHHNLFRGQPGKTGVSAVNDVAVLGGMTGNYDGTWNGGFGGYNTKFTENKFDSIRRWYLGRAVSSSIWTNNKANQYCGAPEGWGAIEIGDGTIGAAGHTIEGNYFLNKYYSYGVALRGDEVARNYIGPNSYWDGHQCVHPECYDVYVDSEAQMNFILNGGHSDLAGVRYLFEGGNHRNFYMDKNEVQFYGNKGATLNGGDGLSFDPETGSRVIRYLIDGVLQAHDYVDSGLIERSVQHSDGGKIIEVLGASGYGSYKQVRDKLGTEVETTYANGHKVIAGHLSHMGSQLGFYGTSAINKPTVSGSKGGNAALGSLITALANLGLITDSTS